MNTKKKLSSLRFMRVEKHKNKSYNKCMDLIKPDKLEDILKGDTSEWTGQEINELLLAVHDNYNYFVKTKARPEMILYYHDILSRLIKTYGH
jgi:hypothetical protein